VTVATIRKGGAWRRVVELWLQDHGFDTTCRGLGFAGDDIVAVRGPLALSVEAKNDKSMALAAFVDQAHANAGVAVPIVVAHRRNHATADGAYFILTGRAFAQLLDAFGAEQ